MTITTSACCFAKSSSPLLAYIRFFVGGWGSIVMLSTVPSPLRLGGRAPSACGGLPLLAYIRCFVGGWGSIVMLSISTIPLALPCPTCLTGDRDVCRQYPAVPSPRKLGWAGAHTLPAAACGQVNQSTSWRMRRNYIPVQDFVWVLVVTRDRKPLYMIDTQVGR